MAPIERESPDAAPGEPRSWLFDFGGVVGAATLGSAAAAVPAALRLASVAGMCSGFGVWALLFGVALVPMSLAVIGIRRARTGLLALGGREGATFLVGLLAWLLASFAALVLLGAVLRSRTHHRALGGVVFGVTAVVAVFGLALVLSRVAKLTRRASPVVLGIVAAVAAGVVGFLVALVRHRLALGASPPFPPSESAKLIDGLAFALSAFIASGHPFVHRRALALVGPPLAAVVFMLGVSSWRTCPALRGAVDEQAPIFAWIARRAAPD